jgi:hypothetical protein
MRLVFLLCLTSLIIGCSSSNRAEVSGTVLLDGQPIEEGSIQFIPTEGTTGPSTGGVITKGKYYIASRDGAIVGKNRVELRSFKMSDKKIQDPTAPPGTLTAMRVQAFPPEYNEQSKVVKEIRPGSNTIDFDVVTKGKGK